MTTCLHLPPRIDRAAAARAFARPRWGNLFGLLGRSHRVSRAEDAPGTLPRFERIWMPVYAICFATTSGSLVRNHSAPTHAWCSVDACSGAFALFEREAELCESDSDEARFPPELDETAAIQAARQGILRYILRSRGKSKRAVVESVAETRLYYAPVWICYFRRFGRYIDIAVLDGYTGEPMGGRMRQAVLNAIIARHRETKT